MIHPRDTFDHLSDKEVIAFLKENRFSHMRKLPGGEWCALMRLAYTWSVCMDITPYTAFRYRWCFEDIGEALYFLSTAEDYDEVPTLKETLKGHRYRDAPLYREQDALGFEKW